VKGFPRFRRSHPLCCAIFVLTAVLVLNMRRVQLASWPSAGPCCPLIPVLSLAWFCVQAEEALPDIDSADKNDPLCVTQYVEDIYAFYKRTEVSISAHPSCGSHPCSNSPTPFVCPHIGACPPCVQAPLRPLRSVGLGAGLTDGCGGVCARRARAA
jgi:hypothetical protein